MSGNTLAIKGGNPVRTREFKSKPYITDEMIGRVGKLMREGRFSRFVGSPIPGTNDILGKKSVELEDMDNTISFLGGPSVRKLESNWSKLHDVDYSIAVNSATSALTSAIMALDIGPGDEVVCSPFSFTASATSIITANAIPVFADIDLETFCLDPKAAEYSLTECTKAIMPIHWNSNAGDLEDIICLAQEKGLKVIEDSSQSPLMQYRGKYLGTHGDAGVFSLNEPKNIMTGEGGIIVTKSSETAIKCRLIRNHGEVIPDKESPDSFVANAVGYNFRLVELLAEIGICQLEKLEYLNNVRKENYTYLTERLINELGDHLIPQKITHSETYYPYTAAFRWIQGELGIHRDIVAHILRSEGIPVSNGIPRLMSENPMFQRQLAFGKDHCPFSCHLYKREGKYTIPEMPNAQRLQEEEYLGFFQIGWPNTRDDMDDIVKGFTRIMDNKDILLHSDLSELSSYTSGK